jgi:heparosan-N-sulfate-glucuronate 5-epimerase
MEHSGLRRKLLRIIGLIITIAALLYMGRIVFGVIELTNLRRYSRITDENQVVHSNTLKPYMLPVLCDESRTTYDQNGIIIVDYSKTTIQGMQSIEYNPGTIAQFALCFYNQYKSTGEEIYRDRFLTQLEWLMTHYVEDPDHHAVFWKHAFKIPQHDVNYTGWASGLTQGVAISALLRGYQMTGNEAYLTAAGKAVNSMIVPLDQGGVAYLAGDDLFFEEVPSGDHILNGNVFGLLGVYEYWLVTKSDSAKEMVDKNIATLKKWLPQFDLGFCSRYSLDQETFRNHWTIASPSYHDLHIDMLQILYDISGDNYFLEMKTRWQSYQNGFPFYLIEASKVIYTDFQLLSKNIGDPY